MSTITPNPTPGAFLDHQTVTFSFGAGTKEVAVTKGNIPPSISKYIAYDTLSPPNPFLAVTEDGRGRVVYDGGFPKFYNGTSYNGATTFAGLNGSCKFLYNALNWVANATKVAAGNKKILILGDNIVSNEYSPKSTASTGFLNTLTMVCNVAGFQKTIKDLSDYSGGLLNPTLSELEQYCLVIVFGVNYPSSPLITSNAVNDIVTYRENGNGIILITDHGLVYNDITSAQVSTGFFSTPNAIATRFGAYFTGDFNRTPVNVGFLRNTYGNHPLYNNLADSESIIAGGSESKVVVSQITTYAPNALPAQTTTIAGINTFNVLAVQNDGSILTARYVYIVQGDEFLWLYSTPSGGSQQTNAGLVHVSDSNVVSIDARVDGSKLGTVWGELLRNGKRIGEIYYSGGVSNLYLYASSASKLRFRKGDSIELKVISPFTYSKTATVQKNEPAITAISEAAWAKELRATWNETILTLPAYRKYPAIVQGNAALPQTPPVGIASMNKRIRDIVSNELDTYTYDTLIYATAAEVSAAIAAKQATPGVCFVNAANGQVYAYLNGSYQAISGLFAKDVFTAPCTLKNGSKSWKMALDGTLTLIA